MGFPPPGGREFLHGILGERSLRSSGLLPFSGDIARGPVGWLPHTPHGSVPLATQGRRKTTRPCSGRQALPGRGAPGRMTSCMLWCSDVATGVRRAGTLRLLLLTQRLEGTWLVPLLTTTEFPPLHKASASFSLPALFFSCGAPWGRRLRRWWRRKWRGRRWGRG